MYKYSMISGLLVASLGFAAQAEEKKEDAKWDVNNPPGEAIYADINVTEGTWMNLDVSPDGEIIAFDLLGDIYTMPISGGKATNITNSMAWDMQPDFSPDGSKLTFTSDQGGGDNIWVMDTDGSDQYQVTKENFRLLNNPKWSPDGDYIAARKHFTGTRSLGAGEIWLYHKSGGSGVKLNSRPNEQKDLGEPAFTPDGQYVLYSRDSTPGGYFEYSKDSTKQIYEIFAINRETGDTETWVDGPGGAVRPEPSPDGKYLAFVRRISGKSALFLQDRKTGEEFPIHENLERDMQETWAIHGVYPNYSWTPDSEEIVYWAQGKLHKIDIDSKDVSDIPFEVQDRREMRAAVQQKNDVAPENFNAKMLRWLQISPEGDKAVFQSLGKLYTVDLPDGEPERVTRQDEHFELYPSFSADGDDIIYTTWHDSKLGSVRIVSANGGSGDVISEQPGHYTNPSLSPDGESAVYQAISGGHLTSPLYSQNTGIFSVNLDDEETTLVSKSGSNPFFAGDSDRVFFSKTKPSGETYSSQLVSTDLEGHDSREHYSGNWISDFAVSPDKKWLAFTQRYQVYVTPFVESGSSINTGPGAKNLPVKKFSTFAGDNLAWTEDGAQLSWSLGPILYQQNLNERFDFLAASSGKSSGKDSAIDAKEAKAKETRITLPVKAQQPKGLTALVGAKVITMEGEQVIDDGVVVIENNRIKSVGSRDQVSIPSGAETIDVSGKTIIPGLVDVHWHGSYSNDQIQPQTNWNALASLAFGVTTTHNPSADTAAVFSASEMQQAGLITAPRIFSTGTILYGANHYITADVNSLDDAVNHLERMKAVGGFSVKSYNQPRRDQRQQVLEAARETGLLVVPEGGSLFMHNMSMIIDGHTTVEHSIPVANIYDDVKQLWSQAETAYVPTLGVGYGGIWGERYWYDKTDVWKHPLLNKYVPRTVLEPASRRRFKAPQEDYNHFNNANVAKELRDLGVKVLLGAHGQREGLAAHWELWMFGQGGMTPLEALQASTIDGAEMLGMDSEIGSIKAGKLADLVILNADPLENLQNSDKVNMVMLNGKLYDASTMNQIAPKKQARKAFYFEN